MTDSLFGYYKAIQRGQVPEEFLRYLESVYHNAESGSFKLDRVSQLLQRDSTDWSRCEIAELFYWLLHHIQASQEQISKSLYPGAIQDVSAMPMSSMDLLNSGWRVEDLVEASVILSERNIKDYERADAELSYWTELRRKSLPFFMGLMYCGEMVGQVALSLITRDELNAFGAGDITERDFKGDEYRGKGTYYGYISTITVDKPFRNSGHVSALLRAALGGVREMHDRGVRLDGVAANAYSPEGDTLCKRAGLTYQREDKEHGRIYTGTMEQVFTSQLAKVLNRKVENHA